MTAIDQLAAALVAAQAEFAAVPKNARNPFFNSRYADLATVIAHAQPILAKHGLAVSQHPCTLDGEPALQTILLHTSGQTRTSTMRLCAAKQDPQGQGAAITYARRFAYQAVLGLVADDDDDGHHATKAKRAEPVKDPADAARERLIAFGRRNRLNLTELGQQFLAQHGVHINDADADTVTAFAATVTAETTGPAAPGEENAVSAPLTATTK